MKYYWFVSFVASASTESSNLITSAVVTPMTDKTEQTTDISSPITVTITSRDRNNTTIRSTLNTTLNIPTEIRSTWFSPLTTPKETAMRLWSLMHKGKCYNNAYFSLEGPSFICMGIVFM